ncbi:hypothetical protein QBC39DRAFT_429674 [Podospora conica]|nr:hypothetical protein QBC39DRAFT_429674 [Schizothecium conicum]
MACEETDGDFQDRTAALSPGRTARTPLSSPPLPSSPPLQVAALPVPAVAVPADGAPAMAAPTVVAPAMAVSAEVAPAVVASAVAAPVVAVPAVVAPAVVPPAMAAPVVAASAVVAPATLQQVGPGPWGQPRRLMLNIKLPPSSFPPAKKTATIPAKRKRAPSDEAYAPPPRGPRSPTAGMYELRRNPRRASGPQPGQYRESTTPPDAELSWDLSGDEDTPMPTYRARVVRLFRRMYGSRIAEGAVPEFEEIPERYGDAALLDGGSQATEPGSPRGELSPVRWGSPEPKEEDGDEMDIDMPSGNGNAAAARAPAPVDPFTLYTFLRTRDRIRRLVIEFLDPPSRSPQNLPIGFIEWSLAQFPGHFPDYSWHPANVLSPRELRTVERDHELHQEMEEAWGDRGVLMRGLADGDWEALGLLWMAYKIRMARGMARWVCWEYDMSQSERWFIERRDELRRLWGDDRGGAGQ